VSFDIIQAMVSAVIAPSIAIPTSSPLRNRDR